jgi:hypothetical protein
MLTEKTGKYCEAVRVTTCKFSFRSLQSRIQLVTVKLSTATRPTVKEVLGLYENGGKDLVVPAQLITLDQTVSVTGAAKLRILTASENPVIRSNII